MKFLSHFEHMDKITTFFYLANDTPPCLQKFMYKIEENRNAKLSNIIECK